MTLEEVLGAYRAGRLSTRELHAWLGRRSLKGQALSHGQRGLWALQRLAPQSCAYNVPLAWRLGEPADAAAFTQACRFMSRQHPWLGSVFVEQDGQPVRVDAREEPAVLIEELGRCSDAALETFIAERAGRPFRLEHEPPVRYHLLCREGAAAVVLVVLHHIVFDGGSLQPFLADFLGAYALARQGGTPQPRPVPASNTYDAFVAWQQRMLSGPEGRAHLDYWRGQLAELPEPLQLPADHARRADGDFRGAVHATKLPQDTVQAVQALSRSTTVGASVVLLAVFKLLLRIHARQDELIVGMPTSGRPDDCFAATIGYFIGMIAVRSRLDPQQPFLELLRTLELTLADGIEHADYPLPLVVRELNTARSLPEQPLFQVCFLYQDIFEHGGPDAVELLPGVHQQAGHDLELEVIEGPLDIALNWKYDARLFDAGSIEQMAGHYLALLEAVLADPGRPLGAYSCMTARERAQLDAWNATAVSHPVRCLHHFFEDRARTAPQSLAVVHGSRRMSCGELEARSRELALQLQARGVGPESRVAVCLERSPEMLVALLGVLRAGGAYVPLDPALPQERLRLLLQDAAPCLLLTQRQLAPRFEGMHGAGGVMEVDASRPLTGEGLAGLHCQATPQNLAYVLYTSGSTGKPKGVMVTHEAITNTLCFLEAAYPVRANDAYLLKTNYVFDVSLSELFGWFFGAGHVVVLPPGAERSPTQVADCIEQHGVTHVNFVPSMLGVFVPEAQARRVAGRASPLRYLMVAGEAFPRALVEECLTALPAARVENIFGPTETAIYASSFSCTRESLRRARTPIGRPIANTRLYVVDSQGRLAPAGVPGELCVAGAGLARGYLGEPELTAGRFPDNPFEPQGRIYRTGDLARWLADGTVEYLGRLDDQVKIRGYRIELGEIESVLAAHDDVAMAAVVVRTQGAARGLAAYCQPRPGARIDAGRLREHLAARLPEYMVPGEVHEVSELPLGATGKLDRKRLLAVTPVVHPAAGGRGAAAGGLMERLLSIWCDVLDRRDISPDQGFFDAGGDSIAAAIVVKRMEDALGFPLEPTVLFRHATVRSLAAHLESLRKDAAAAPAQPAPPPAAAADARPAPHASLEGCIALIGISCHLPMARDHRELWRNLCEGVESVERLSPEELRAAGVAESLLRDPRYVPVRSCLAGKELFDPGFFGIAPADAELMDPQLRQLLMHAWRAVEDAGYAVAAIPDTAVYMSTGNNGYAALAAAAADGDAGYVSWVLGQSGTVPTYISHKLGFTGPSIAVHSNCSSGLTGLHLARRSLLLGEARQALVGAASIFPRPALGYLHSKGMNLSSDGHLRAFDADADGMVGGEGVAVLLFKRAQDAFADGDHIYALIRGVSINNDGAGKAGFYAPSIQGQAAVIRRALEDAQVAPGSIGYIEAHGTGTRLGDPIEVAALREAFAGAAGEHPFCAIGSIKSNIGHLDTAAGLAGCIKVALSLEHGQIPPTLNFRRANPALGLEGSPFFIAGHLMPWSVAAVPRRAALSSFGIGGTNVHVVCEQAVETAPPAAASPDARHIVPLSARSSERLRAAAGQLLGFLSDAQATAPAGEPAVADLAYTLQVGRTPMPARVAFVVGTLQELREALRAYLDGVARADCFTGGEAGESLEWLTSEEQRELCERSIATRRWERLAALWARGGEVDWMRIWAQGARPRRLSLPTYPFALEPYWISAAAAPAARPPATPPETVSAPMEADESVRAGAHLLVQVWEPDDGAEPGPGPGARGVLVVGGEAELRAVQLSHPGAQRLELPPGAGARDIQSALRAHGEIAHVILVAPAEPAWSLEGSHLLDAQHDGVILGLRVIKALLALGHGERPLAFTALTFGTQPVFRQEPVAPAHASLHGLVGALAKEQPGWSVRLIDLASREELGTVPWWRLPPEPRGRPCAHRAGRWYRPRLLEVRQPGAAAPSPYRQGGVYVVIGGAGHVGRIWTERVMRQHGARVVWIGRREPDGAIRAQLERLRAFGEPPEYVRADAADLGSLKAACDEIRGRHARIDGVVVAAVTIAPAALHEIPEEQFLDGLRAKTAVSLRVAQVFRDTPLDFILFFSSLISYIKNPRQADYAAGSTFADAFAQRLALELAAARTAVRIMHWGFWNLADGAGTSPEALQRLGIGLINPEEGMAALDLLMSGPLEEAGFMQTTKPILVEGAIPRESVSPQEALLCCASPRSAARAPAAAPQAPAGDEREPLRRQVLAQLSACLKLDAAQIDTRRPFADYGLDSIRGLHFVRLLGECLSLDLDPTLIFDHSSVDQLTAHLLAAHGDELAALRPAAVAAPAGAPAASAAAPAPAREPVAIIGMACRFARSRSPRELWEHVSGGENLVAEVTRWDLPAHVADADALPCRHASLLESIHEFDPVFFGISGLEANYMDPKQRLFLEECWHALEDAGHAGEGIRGRRIGVYVGNEQADYDRLIQGGAPGQAVWGTAGSLMPARIAYHLDLQGPAIAVDTACSSSLVAIHLACQSLWMGEIEMALAGGVSVESTPAALIGAGAAGMLSRSGRCYSFDSRADGFVPGEGVGVVVLKPLAAALRDGDPIHGVIRGTGINQDGATNGITAPSARSQQRLQSGVYAGFGIDPAQIQMVEAHGTGTPLGDPIEINALTRSFRERTERRQYCALGSIKTNLGHTKAAAGIAGVLKILLSLAHRQIPPSLNFETANPKIDFASSPFYVNTRLAPWPQGEDGAPRLAAVSAFGMSGTNAHLVIGEAPAHTRASPAASAHLVVLSARSGVQLRELALRLAAHCEEVPALDLGNVCYTLFTGRRHLAERLACVVADRDGLITALRGWLEGGSPPDVRTGVSAPGRIHAGRLQHGQACIERCRAEVQSPGQAARLLELAGLYVEGCELPYERLFDPAQHARVCLPTYPFARHPHWIPNVAAAGRAAAGTTLHPLLHENTSSLEVQRFSSRFTGTERFLSDHIVAGRRVLPAVAYLEMVRAGMQRSLSAAPGAALVLRNVVWVRPLVAGEPDASPQVHLSLRPRQDGEIDFTVTAEADGGPVLHSQGRVAVREGQPRPQLALTALRAQCASARLTHAEYYGVLQSELVKYGEAYRGVAEVFVGAGQALARLELPACVAAESAACALHPCLLDAALQSSRALHAPGQGGGAGLPFALEQMEVFAPCPAQAFAWARWAQGSGPADAVQRIDIDVCDADGRVCVRMQGFSSRPPRAADAEQAGDAAPPALLTEVAESLRAAGAAARPVPPPPDQLDALLARLLACQLQAAGVLDGQPRPLPSLKERVAPAFGRWLEKSIEVLVEHGQVSRQDGCHALTPAAADASAGAWQAWEAARATPAEGSAATLELLDRMLRALPEILSGRQPATGVMFGEASVDLVGDVYQGNTTADYYNSMLADAVAACLDARLRRSGAPLRILEIGAGTGGTSAVVLERLRGHEQSVAEYCYTDLSRAFLLHARERFGGRHPYLAFRVFDVSRPPASQGIEPGSYDLVIATNVLHATRDIREALRNARAVLRPHGLLMLNEITGFTLIAHLSFGLLAGWWLFDDDALRVPGCPAVPPQTWDMVLRTEGFHAVHFPAAAAHQGGQQIVLAECDATPRSLEPRPAAGPGEPPMTGSEAPPAADLPAGSGQQQELHRRAADYLRRLTARTIEISASEIDTATPLEKYGIDSLLVVRLTSALGAVLRDVSSTLFFEHQTIDALALQLVRTREAEMRALLGGEEPVASVPRSPAATPPAPQRFLAAAPPDVPAAPAAGAPLRQDVAIIGFSGRFPQADSLEELWQNLLAGRDCITELPAERWDWRAYFDPVPGRPGRTYSRWGGFLRDIDRFDALFFHISPRDAENMDPQERLFLEESYRCIEDAGYTPRGLSASRRVGVFAGVMNGGYTWGATYYSIANRVSYTFDFQGPSLAVDTACSSSLTAIHLAVESLAAGSCECALAGGVNLILGPLHYLKLSAQRMLSAGAHCRPFGAGADGLVDGEAVGVALLKPLGQALADGDHVYAVVKSSLVNAGGKTNGYTVPNPNAQAALISQALERAGLSGRDINYVEAHGTGTDLGDPIEIAALTRAYAGAAPASCAIGSIKSNIGHCESAAGIAGLAKVLLQLQHRRLVPSLHAEQLNPRIDFTATPFVVQRVLGDWHERHGGGPRLAAISSFGAGGANAHLIVQEHVAGPRAGAPLPHGAEVAVLLSARTVEDLLARVGQLAQALESGCWTDDDLPAIAYTLQVGREALEERLAVLAGSIRSLKDKLAACAQQRWEEVPGVSRGSARRSRELLGSLAGDDEMQEAIGKWVQRGKLAKLVDLWSKGLAVSWERLHPTPRPQRISLPTYPFAGERYWTALPQTPALPAGAGEVLHPLLHRNISDDRGLRFTARLQGHEPFLADHLVQGLPTLPGVACLEMACAAIRLARGLPAADPVGYELTNVVWLRPLTCGASPTAVDLKLSLREGRDEAGFEILSVAAEGEDCVHARGEARVRTGSVPPVLDLAALRAQTLEEGPGAAEHYALFESAGIRYGASHRGVQRVWRLPGGLLAQLGVPDTAPGFMLHPGVLDSALQACLTLLIAAGAGQAAAGRETPAAALPFALDALEVFADVPRECWALIRGSTRGPAGGLTRIDIEVCDSGGRMCARLQGLTFKSASGSRAQALAGPAAESGTGAEGGELLGTQLLAPRWEACGAGVRAGGSLLTAGQRVLVAGTDAALLQALRSHSPGAELLDAALPPHAPVEVLGARLAQLGEIDQVLWVAPTERCAATDEALVQAQTHGVLACFRLIKALLAGGHGSRRLGFTVVTRLAQEVLGTDRVAAAHASVHGLAGSLAKEYPGWAVRVLDLGEDGWPLPQLWQVRPESSGEVLAHREGEWYRQRLLPVRGAAAGTVPAKMGGLYVVIGGAGGIGEVWSEWMMRNYQARIVWIGRRAADERIHRSLERLAAWGPAPQYIAADAAVPAELTRALEQIRREQGVPVNGVVHSAIVLGDRSLARMTEEGFVASLRAKVDVSVRLAQVFGGEPLDFVLFFSSFQSFSKAAGQSNYAAGCTFEDAYAAQLRSHLPCAVKVMNWGWWGGQGIVASPAYRERMERVGLGSLEPDEGMAALEQLLRGPLHQLALIKTTHPQVLESFCSDDRLDVSGALAGAADAALPVAQITARTQALVDAAHEDSRSGALQAEMERCLAAVLLVQLAGLAGGQTPTRPLLEARLHPQYRRWLQEAWRQLAEQGRLQAGTGREPALAAGQVDAQAAWSRWEGGAWRHDPALAAQTLLLDATLRALPAVLKGERPATDVLFSQSSVQGVQAVYQDNPGADFFNILLAETALACVEERLQAGRGTRLRLLEIGAGTGATSAQLFARLAPHAAGIEEYCYTDISRSFLIHAQDRHGGLPFLSFRQLDIEQAPAAQGIEPARYDLVIAANVLHATRSVRVALRNAKSLLRPGGVLLLNEVNANGGLAALLTFGLLKGWWLYEDEALRLQGCPALAPDTWQRVLAQEGFHSVHFPARAAHGLGQQIIAACSDGIIRQARRAPVSAPARVPPPVQAGARAPQEDIVAVPATPADVPAGQAGPPATSAQAPTERELIGLVRHTIIEQLSQALRIRESLIDEEESFADYGLDSISGVNLVQTLNDTLGCRLATTSLFEFSSVKALAAHILAGFRPALEERVRARAAQPVAATPVPVSPARAAPVSPSSPAPEPPAGTAGTARAAVPPDERRVAVIGMSGRFPGAATLDELWAHLRAGEDLVRPVRRWDLDQFLPAFGSADGQGGPYCRHGAYLEDIDQFDALFFKISGSEASYMDPQQRIFLEQCWTALEDAGYAGEELKGSPCGVYVGYAGGDYHELFSGSRPAQAFWGNAGSIVPARIAYYMDLKGPAIAIDTACSSSLVAMHMACQGLWCGEIDLALAGGVHVQITPSYFLSASRGGMLSPTGRCHTFDERADGFVPGEGAGVVVLKRLSRALEDGDHIHGVIVASGVNQDGTTNGITAPNAASQEELIRGVYERFGIHADSIRLVEAHGTGTRLGDPIEVSALTRAFRHATSRRQYCALGSIKTNLGHTATAAGVAGVLKVLLALRHRQLPPSLHFRTVNPHIDLADSPFYVSTRLEPWHAEPDPAGGDYPRRAAVSSFGFSGTNAHIVLEEAPRSRRTPAARPGHLILLSGRTGEELQRQVRNLCAHVRRTADLECGDVSLTLALGRRHRPHRLACIVRDLAELASLLETWLAQGAAPSVRTGGPAEAERADQTELCERGRRHLAAFREDSQTDGCPEQLAALADLYVQGADLRLADLFKDSGYGRVPLPTYPFTRKRHWVGGAQQAAERDGPEVRRVEPDRTEPEAGSTGAARLLAPVWESARVPDAGALTPGPQERVLIVAARRSAGAEAPVRELLSRYPQAERIEPPREAGELEALRADERPIDHIIWIADPAAIAARDESMLQAQEEGVFACFRLIKALLHAGHGRRRLGFTVLTTRTQAIRRGERDTRAAQAALHGLMGSLAKEYPGWSVRVVDLGGEEAVPWDVLLRLPADPRGNALCLRAGQWYRQQLAGYDAAGEGPPVYRDGGTYVVIGGAGGIGEAWTRWMIERHQARIFWIGRRERDAGIDAKIERLGRLGPAPVYVRADAGDAAALGRACTHIKGLSPGGRIHGLVHAAIVLSDASVAGMRAEHFEAAVHAKTATSIRMAQVFGAEDLELVLFFSSFQSFSRAPGQCNYAAGCTFADAYARQLSEEFSCPVKVMNWGWWGSIGVVASPEYRQRMGRLGLGSIEPAEGMAALESLLRAPVDALAFVRTTRAELLEHISAPESVQSYPAVTSILDRVRRRLKQAPGAR